MEALYGLTRLVGHGRAFSEVLTVANPVAGAGFTYTVPSPYWILLDSLSFQLVSDANAANRQVTLTVRDGSGVALVTLPSASVQAASLTYQYSFSPSFTGFNTVVGLAVTAPLPMLFLQPGFALTLAIGAVQVTDQVSNIRLYAERFDTGPGGYEIGMVEETRTRYLEALRLAELAA